MKKTTLIKIASVCVAGIPPVVVLCCNMPVFIEQTGKAISAAALLVGVILVLIFKDATKKFFQTPSAFKTCVVVFILSLIAVNLGEQMLQISLTAMISGACALPLNMWYNNLTQPASTDDIVDALKDLVKGDANSEESNKEN